ncbi:SRPBCC domain-containing protein [Variovorax sp. J22P240]|uniref:SRPBCC family protein n=1 Tax=Variovorax sp. J22P240 TaxID=3053514 RepID=UPI002575311C|nr:SRPBCC domain-containing protein [Variovorax sp. J22P240]MDM0002882.1 SRPBCC domain-containing protein [Variovorax sp. J22P240]
MASPATRDEERPSLTLRRHFDASPDKVWRAWTEPQALKQWFGPEEIVAVPVAEVDLRIGGGFRVVMVAADGERHEVSGLYREIVPDRKLVFSWSWVTTPERVSRVTVSIEPAGRGTELTLRHEDFFDEAARDGHNHGWTGSLVKLQVLLGGARADG